METLKYSQNPRPDAAANGAAADGRRRPDALVRERLRGPTPGELPTIEGTPTADLNHRERRDPPAHEVRHGRVVTRIWAHKTHWGPVCWQVDQLRDAGLSAERRFTRSMERQDLWHAIQGMYAALNWVKQTDRKLSGRPRRWFW